MKNYFLSLTVYYHNLLIQYKIDNFNLLILKKTKELADGEISKICYLAHIKIYTKKIKELENNLK